MKHLLLVVALFIQLATLTAQQSQFIYASSPFTSGKSYFKLGDRLMIVARYGADNEVPYVLLSLHSNEVTSIEAARDHVAEHGGLFIELQNEKQRLIAVDMYDRTIAIDPNRIFTTEGRQRGIHAASRKDERIRRQITEFSDFILNEIPTGKVIVALHNNTDEEYSIQSYQKHPAIKKDAEAVHINSEMDEDDFYYTTSRDIFEKLKEKNVNVVLQSSKAYDDGSLSIYCGTADQPYVNIETELGHFDEQKKMLKTLAEILRN